tara:strand:- start:407 stop:1648 length:1242 start_codon:yes stop_codon:yes gene_type:complete
MKSKFFFAFLSFIFANILVGQPGPAIHTDGVDDFINMGTSQAFAVSSSQSRSFLIDFKPQSYGGFLVSRYQNGSALQSSFFITINPNGKIGVAGNGSNAIQSFGNVILNQWQRLIVTIDANGTTAIYLDGVLDKSSNINLNSSIPNIDFTVGTRQTSATANLFDGSIDNLIIWNGVMAGPDISNFTNCLPPAYHPNMIAKWSFDEMAGLSTFDAVSAQVGSLSANTLWTNDAKNIIIQQPVSDTFSTVPGDAYFSITYSDSVTTYLWQQNDNNGWLNLSDTGIYSGTMTDSLVLTGITSSLNGFEYRCIINGCEIDTSDIAILTVIDNIGLNDNNLSSVTLSPNPNSGLFSIQVDQENIGSSYWILDNLGRLIDKGVIRELSQDFNLSDKPKGVYRIQVSNDKAIKTLNVVIQ